jgi:hypothetical protein
MGIRVLVGRMSRQGYLTTCTTKEDAVNPQSQGNLDESGARTKTALTQSTSDIRNFLAATACLV